MEPDRSQRDHPAACVIAQQYSYTQPFAQCAYIHEKESFVRPAKTLLLQFFYSLKLNDWSHWPRCSRRRSAAARLLRSWVRIPPGEWMS